MFREQWVRWRGRKERRAEFHAQLQKQVALWHCPRCNTQDLRLLEPFEEMVLECAECHYKTQPIPRSFRPKA